MGLKQQAVRSIAWNTAAKVLTDITSVVQLAVVARYIDKADFGLMSTVHVVLGMVMMFADLGMYAALMHKQEISEEQYSSVYWMNWMLNGSLFLLICAIAYPVSLFYDEPRLTFLIILLGSNALLSPFGKIYYTVKQKNLEFGFISKVAIFVTLVTFSATIVMCLMGCGIFSLIVPVLIGSAVRAFIFVLEGRRHTRIRFHFRFSEIRDMVGIGLWNTGAQLLDYVCYKLDVLLIGKLFGMEVLGLYNMGKELALKAFKVISSMVGPILAPLLSKFQNDMALLERNYLQIIRFVTFVCFPVLMALCIFAEPTVRLFFSEKYVDAAPFVSILCFWGMFASVGGFAGNLVIATGRTDLEFRWTVVRLVCVPVAVVIASFFSPVAIAWSQVILQCFFFFIYWRMIIYATAKIPFSHYLVSVVPALICSLAAVLPSLAYHRLCVLGVWADLLGGCAVFAVTYLVASWLLNRSIYNFVSDVILTFTKRQ